MTAAGVGGGGSGSAVGGSSHNYPPDFLASGDLYGYAVVSATALKADFLAAVPAISNALKSVYNCLETCRVHVESYAGDELPTKVPRSPKLEQKFLIQNSKPLPHLHSNIPNDAI